MRLWMLRVKDLVALLRHCLGEFQAGESCAVSGQRKGRPVSRKGLMCSVHKHRGTPPVSRGVMMFLKPGLAP